MTRMSRRKKKQPKEIMNENIYYNLFMNFAEVDLQE